MEISTLAAIWNRAAMQVTSGNLAVGDRALANLLKVHGLFMNGGVLNAVEICDESTIEDAIAGYRFFGFESIGELITNAKDVIRGGVNLGSREHFFDSSYRQIASDAAIYRAFELHVTAHPEQFAPLNL